MDYSELVDAVGEITKRGERIPLIQFGIAKATLKAHLSDFWQRDIVEKILAVDNTNDPLYEISVNTFLPKFRKVSYLHGWDGSGKLETHEFTEMKHFRDMYHTLYSDNYYLAGDTLNLRSSQGIQNILIGYYKVPDTREENYDSWIAEIYPMIIIDEACSEVFGSIGDIDESKRRRDMWVQNFHILQVNELETTGR